MDSKKLREEIVKILEAGTQTYDAGKNKIVFSADTNIDAIMSAIKDHVDYVIGEDKTTKELLEDDEIYRNRLRAEQRNKALKGDFDPELLK